MQLKDPRKVRVIYERINHWSEVFDNNPRIAQRGEQGDFQLYQPRVNGMRPYCTAKTPEKWTWKDYKPLVGEFWFAPHELCFASERSAPDVVVEPTVKTKASPNKDWGWERWQALVHMLASNKIRVAQVGPQGTKCLNGARLIATSTFRNAAAVLARAKAAVLPEGGLHHAAAAVGVPAVVIYGGYISPRQTGYDLHTNIFTGGEPCGMRTACPHCVDAMAKISPEQIFAAVMKILEARS